MQRILVVDDEPDIVEFISYNLSREGYDVRSASNGAEALTATAEFHPQLVIMDMMMPVMNGEEACRKLRSMEGGREMVIVFLSAMSAEEKQIGGYDAGADDYIAKPVAMNVLRSRVNAIMRRLPNPGKVIEVDEARHSVAVNGHNVHLTKREFDLLVLLRSEIGVFHSRKEIFDKVWGNDIIVGDRTLDVHVRSLRKKIGDRHIVTKRGVGFRYEE